MGQDIRVGVPVQARIMWDPHTTENQGKPLDQAMGIISKTYPEQNGSS
jgi:hypothetical protein